MSRKTGYYQITHSDGLQEIYRWSEHKNRWVNDITDEDIERYGSIVDEREVFDQLKERDEMKKLLEEIYSLRNNGSPFKFAINKIYRLLENIKQS